jgi:hypothetical protein
MDWWAGQDACAFVVPRGVRNDGAREGGRSYQAYVMHILRMLGLILGKSNEGPAWVLGGVLMRERSVESPVFNHGGNGDYMT